MALIKVIEVLAESPNSWEEAAQTAVKQASESVRGIASVYVKEFEAKVENDRKWVCTSHILWLGVVCGHG